MKITKRRVPPLHELIIQGFDGGMKWMTQATEVVDEKTQSSVKKCRFLLHYPQSFHTSKIIVRSLRAARPLLISLALADVYDFAAEKVSMCAKLEPREFFARAKNSFIWSSSLNDNEFWVFTYKAFHARSIFLNTVLRPGEEIPIGSPLSQSLDNFRDQFLARYPTEHVDVLEGWKSHSQENIELAEDRVFTNKLIRERYFPRHLTHYDGQGDGTDKLVAAKNAKWDPWKQPAVVPILTCKRLSLREIHDKELFFFDTECKANHHDACKDAPISGGSERQEIGAKESTRKYDAFKDYREPAGGEEEGGGEDAGEGDEFPPFKKLKMEEQ
ncbi:hypothetical protein F5Y05DRAFT_292955 [Hypoxylon sp. FL0543]|nr:hypothetical protein F5Y05DRAFT_292955 [Hypoxylon sp. FL0543]